jgi:hypothetical protein
MTQPTPRSDRHGEHQQRHATAAIDAATPMIHQLPQLYAWARDWSPGYPTGGDGTGRTATPDGSPPPPGTWQPRPVDDLDAAVRDLIHACDRFNRMCTGLAARSTDTGRRNSGGANCAGCDRHVTNSPVDRLRSGLCQACYGQVRRLHNANPHLDRGDVLLLWAREQKLDVLEDVAP